MIRVHVWNFRGLKTAMGHASMHVGANYISWWPEGTDRSFKIPGSVGRVLPLYTVGHIHGQSFSDDQMLEALDEHSDWDSSRSAFVDRRTGVPVKPLKPHHSIRIDGLDENRITDWWKKFNVPGRQWSTIGQNCATTVGRGLMIGGADDYSPGASGWWHSWNTVWQPNDVLRYSHEIRRGLAAKQSQHAAINLVRRFCTSPLGFTSITMNMDEKGLAEAIYSELASNTGLIRDVFRELDERRNTDADDIAEIYVNLLRTKKGPSLAAVAKDSALKKLLIKLLDEGWTSAGEQKCIGFLKSLH